MSWRTLETLAWFALYGGLIAFLLTWNTASPTYRAVYVERSAADWIPDASRDYVPGTTIRGNAPSPYFARSWWRPEPQMRWGRGSESTLVLVPTADIAVGSRLVVRLGAFVPGPMRITVNGEEVLAFETMRDPQAVEAVLPALPAGEPVTIAFLPAVAKSPLALGRSTDQRELGVRFVDLTIVPAP